MVAHETNGSHGRRRRGAALAWLVAACFAGGHRELRADAFADYALARSFALPPGFAVFDVLPDGRVLALSGAVVHVETSLADREFTTVAALPNADVGPFGAAFLRVSPDGTRVAVGNNGGASFADYQVGVFAWPSLQGDWFAASHFDAEWFDNRYLAISAVGTTLTMLDTQSADPLNPVKPVIVSNISGASAGICFDSTGRLFTGDGFSAIDTGVVRAFAPSAWLPALSGGPPVDFQTDGAIVVDLLSAASLGFDYQGNLHVGGGDFVGGSDLDFAGLVRNTSLADALAGLGAANTSDPMEVRRLDPDGASSSNFYSVNANAITGELYVQDFGSSVVHVYTSGVTVPATSTWGIGASAVLLIGLGVVLLKHRRTA